MRASKVREDCGALDGRGEWAEGGGRSCINSCWLRGGGGGEARLSTRQEPRRRDTLTNSTDTFIFQEATNETPTKIHLVLLLFFFFFLVCVRASRGFYASGERVKKKKKKPLRRWVLRGLACSYRICSPDKGIRGGKIRLSMIFSKRRLQRWSD